MKKFELGQSTTVGVIINGSRYTIGTGNERTLSTTEAHGILLEAINNLSLPSEGCDYNPFPTDCQIVCYIQSMGYKVTRSQKSKTEKLLAILEYVEDINEDIKEDDDELIPGVTYDDITDLKILLNMKLEGFPI